MNEQDKAREYLESKGFNYDHFTKLTSTGISPDYDNIIKIMSDYTTDLEADLLQNVKWLHEAEKKVKELEAELKDIDANRKC